MKTLVLPLLLAFAPLAGAAEPTATPAPAAVAEPAVAAQPAVAVEPAAAADPAVTPAPADETVAISASDAPRSEENACIRETGTRIAARDEEGCTGAPGDSYDRDDIDRTGAVDTADAIRKLSPSATIRR
jgi:hypothetical protein